ncbi:MAG: MBOAT family protein [Lachnospiraceae bacterium]|nr:MBOAT family protein [Lachnospiraceae bacterium]
MLFNSYIFLLAFGPITIILYRILQRLGFYRVSLSFLIIASLCFYGYQKPPYALLLIGSILTNYGIYLILNKISGESLKIRKLIMIAGIVINLALLFYFKYMNFFITNINSVFGSSFSLMNVVLPLGISFYTFQQISFVVDSYNNETKGYTFLEYALFVSFFPQLIAGPIVLHNELIPQFRESQIKSSASTKYMFKKVWEGIQFFIIGLSKKLLIADFLGRGVDWGYTNISSLNTLSSIFLILAYTLQIYFDFSGYCDMAIGLGKMIGFDITDNFNSPYKSLSVTEFWKRWHITLTRFLTKYLYIPLGGNRKGKTRTLINVFLVFLISGLWHGANWTFIFWGAIHGIIMVIERIITADRLKKLPKALRFIYTFAFVNIAWVFFRSEGFGDVLNIFKRVFLGGFHLLNDGMINQMFSVSTNPIFSRFGIDVASNQLVYCVLSVIAILLITLLATKHKNTREIVSSNVSKGFYPVILGILFVLCLINISGVSAFLYFNF